MSNTMLAVVKPASAPGIEIREVPKPQFGLIEVLVKVKMASICGTDLHIYQWDQWAQRRIHPPLIPGHEFCGTVEAVGDEVTSVKQGDFVSAEMHVACGKCLQCRIGEAHICQHVKIIGVDTNGAFAEYVVIPESNIWKLDPSILPEYASILDPRGNAVHTVLAGDIATKSVAITGCGPIGLFSIAVARACGATQIFALEVNEHRRKIARQMKPDFVLDPTKDDVYQIVMDNTGGTGVDVVLEMAGRTEAIRTGFKILRLGGRISLQASRTQPRGRSHLQRRDRAGHQRTPHVSDLVSDDRAAEGQQARSASCHHRPHCDERFRARHGAAEDRRGQQNPGVSRRNEIAVEEARNELANNARCTHAAPILGTASSATWFHQRMEGLRFSSWRMDMGRGRTPRTGKGCVHFRGRNGWNSARPKNPSGLSRDEGAGCVCP